MLSNLNGNEANKYKLNCSSFVFGLRGALQLFNPWDNLCFELDGGSISVTKAMKHNNVHGISLATFENYR